MSGKLFLGLGFTVGAAMLARRLWRGPGPIGPGNGAPLPPAGLTPTHEAPTGPDATGVYQTPLSAVGAPDWIDVPGVGTVTRLPIDDLSTGGFARLTYSNAMALAEKLGAVLLSSDEVSAIDSYARERGQSLAPCILPAGPAMASLAYCRKHDECVRAQIHTSSVVSNAGKDWCRGAPKGKAFNYGWIVANAPIQPLSSAHADYYVDYSQLSRFKKVG